MQREKWQKVCSAHPGIESGVHTFEAYDVPGIITLRNFSNLRKLHVRGVHHLGSLEGLSYLREIILFDSDLLAISDLPNVRDLEVRSCANLRKISALPRLERLEIYNCPALEFVQRSLSLKKMVFDGCPNLRSISHCSRKESWR